MKKKMLFAGLAVAFGLSFSAAAQTPAAQQGAPTVKTGSALKAKAATPAPSATAKNKSQKTSVGQGKATAKASAPSAVYAAGNKAGKPAGSGYYVVGLNAGQCAAKKAGAYGCKFDTNGNPTECGAIAVNDVTGEVTVVAVN
jgi:hypothetical protein